MTAVAAPREQALELGRVISSGFALIRRRPVTLLLLAAFLAYLPAVTEVWGTKTLAHMVPKAGTPSYWPQFWAHLGVLELLALAIAGVNWIFQGAVALCALPTASVDEALAPRVAARALTLFLTGLLSNLGVLLATLALFVPGILLGLAWSAAPAVTAAEPRGFIDALRRSAALTRNRRGAILGLFVLYGVVRAAVVYGLRFALATPTPLQINSGADYLVYGVQPVASVLLSIVYAAVMAAVYLELRRIHDGVALGSVADTFD